MKSKTMAIFDPGSIELSFTGKINKNTLPQVKESFTNWLNSFDAKGLETDKDFAEAATFVTECKRVEERLDGIKEDMFKGDTAKAIKEIDEMKETTRQKRLEFSRAVDARKTEMRSDAITKAMADLNIQLMGIPHRKECLNAETPKERLTLAIKGKSAILKMQEALEAESEKILEEAKAYSHSFDALRSIVASLYANAGETATDSELDMMVTTHFDDAPERAKLILQQKKVARDQAELDRQKSAPAPAPAPVPQTAASQDQSKTKRTLRFGATFDTSDPEQTISLIASIGGRDVKFQEFKKTEVTKS